MNRLQTYLIIVLPLIFVLGLIVGYFTNLIQVKLLCYLGEYTHSPSLHNSIALSILFNIIVMGLFNINIYFKSLMRSVGKKFLSTAFMILVLLGIFWGLFFWGGYNSWAWVFSVLSLIVCIWIGTDSFSNLAKGSIKKSLAMISGACIGGAIAGIFIGIAFILRTNFSIDEGYFILTALLLSLRGIMLGIAFLTLIFIQNFILTDKGDLFLSNLPGFRPFVKKVLPLLVVSILLLFVTMFNYWETLGLNSDFRPLNAESKDNVFVCSKIQDVNIPKEHKKNDLMKFLEKNPNKDISTLAYLYLLSGDDIWAEEFKATLLQEASNKKFVGYGGSVKGFQYQEMVRAYYFLLVSEKNPSLFNKSEVDLITEWFKEINEKTFRVRWVDWIYALLLKRYPSGPYPNQEMGVGLLSVLSEVLRDKYSELSKKDKEYVNHFGIGWKGNFRNPDDMIVYGQSSWIANAYMLAKYGGKENYLQGNNSRNSFEWILVQWPPNGMSPAYNVPSDYTPFDLMILGAYIFSDGRYLWLANRMLSNEVKNMGRTRDPFIGLNYWNDNIPMIRPTIGTCYIKGATGVAQKPGPLKPDKIVFRDGWDKDSFYALLNLRFSGWHSYKATNSFVLVMYGEPFVVEKLELRKHNWLPEAKADHRDKKIDRIALNGFQVKKTGLERLVCQITGFGSSWAQDPPRFADVVFFDHTPLVDFSKTRISNWHGWIHDRVSILVKNRYFVVLDHAKGNTGREVGITWHLKGTAERENQSIKLLLNNYSLRIHYPHSKEWYETQLATSDHLHPSAGYIHDPDIDFWMISKNRPEVTFATLIYPERAKSPSKVEKIDVLNDENQSAYPKVLGIKIIEANGIDLVAASFEQGIFTYDNVRTDAGVFVVQKNSTSWNVSFKDASLFKLYSDKKPAKIELDMKELVQGIDWNFSGGIISVQLSQREGHLKIEFRGDFSKSIE